MTPHATQKIPYVKCILEALYSRQQHDRVCCDWPTTAVWSSQPTVHHVAGSSTWITSIDRAALQLLRSIFFSRAQASLPTVTLISLLVIVGFQYSQSNKHSAHQFEASICLCTYRAPPLCCCHDNCRDLPFLLSYFLLAKAEGCCFIENGLVSLTSAVSLCSASVSSSGSQPYLNDCLRASWHLRARHQSASRQPPSGH